MRDPLYSCIGILVAIILLLTILWMLGVHLPGLNPGT